MIWLCLLLAADPTLEDLWRSANQHYQEGEHQEALTRYQTLLEEGVDNGPLHFNIGNAYFRVGDLGRAILHYYKARRYLPDDPDLAANLALAEQQRIDPIIEGEAEAFGDAFHDLAHRLPYVLVFYGALFFLTLAGAVCLIRIFRTTAGKWFGYALTIGLTFGLLLGAAAFVQYDLLTRNDQAVVIADQVDALSGPSTRETVSFTIHEGIRCRILDEAEGWRRIRLANGYNGWVPRTSVEKI